MALREARLTPPYTVGVSNNIKYFKMRIFLLSFLIGFQFTLSQESKSGEIFFNNGNIIKGIVNVGNSKISVKKNIDGRSITFGHMGIDSVRIYNSDSVSSYIYKKHQKKILLLEVISTGKVQLFMYTFPQVYGYGGFSGGGTMHYLGRKGESSVTRLTVKGVVDKSFKKSTSKFFKDCPKLVEKIKNREYRRDDIIEIVNYYNFECQ